MMDDLLIAPMQDVRPDGVVVWFEYHCLESADSSDADIWYRSHQRVRIVRLADHDAGMGSTKQSRATDGTPIAYWVRFSDGQECCVFEDELLDSPTEFHQPDPPNQK
jgi:hypothetical protein